MKNFTLLTLSAFFISTIYSQDCGINVPNYNIDLTGAPDSSWVLFEEDALERNGQCCGAGSNENCISFEITNTFTDSI